jgi:hypothetical protein
VQQFWSDEELVLLGAREEAISRASFIDATEEQLAQVAEDFRVVQDELTKLEAGPTREVSIADTTFFTVRRGRRITRRGGDLHPGLIPVYSGSKDPKRALCYVSEQWAKEQGIPIEEHPIITVNANGAVGACFVRRERCIIHDDVMIIEVTHNRLNLDYLVQALRSAIAEGNFEYEAKLYSRVKELAVAIPTTNDGEFDLARQQAIADVLKRFDSLRASLDELGRWAAASRISD